ncbi:MAG: hypothetical protein M0Z95_14340 [Actinomycetota bacterium]|jgi:hypothetical protein|nr:hypothetical protein [Actinomycetota bacterium]
MAQEGTPDQDHPGTGRPVPRSAAPAVVAWVLFAVGAAVALALLAVLSAVAVDPVGEFVAVATNGGYRVMLEWPRLVAFTVLAAGDVVLLVLAGRLVLREPPPPEGSSGNGVPGPLPIVVRAALVFPAAALAFVILGLLTDGGPDFFVSTAQEVSIAAGILVVATTVALVILWAAPRHRLAVLWHGPWSANAIALLLVLIGTAVPYAVTAAGSPVGESVVLTGFAELLPAPAPRLTLPYQVVCGDPEHCVVVAGVQGLPASEGQIMGISATADAGRTWHSVLVAGGFELPPTGLTCRASSCWGWASNTDQQRGQPAHAIVSVSISSSGVPRITSRPVARRLTVEGYEKGTCWSPLDCLLIVPSVTLLPATHPASTPFAPSSGTTASPGETALITSDGGTQWQDVSIPYVSGTVVHAASSASATIARGPWCTGTGSCLVSVSAEAQGCRPVSAARGCPYLQVVDATTDGGLSWKSRSSLPQSASPMPILCSSPPVCVANTLSPGRLTFVLSDDAGASWGTPVPMAPSVSLLSCSATACVRVQGGSRSSLSSSYLSCIVSGCARVQSGAAEPVQASLSVDGARTWSRAAVLFRSRGTKSEDNSAAACAAAGPCIVASWQPGLDPHSAVVAVSAPGGAWRVRTLPPPPLPASRS